MGKRVSKEDKVSKILRCLPPKWNSKTEAIEEVKNLKELPLEELIGSLMTYEVKIARQEMQEEEGTDTCFMALEDQDEVSSNSDDEECIFEYDELLKFIYKLDEKNTLLKNKVFELDEIKEKFSKVEVSKISLKKENEDLLKKNEWLVSSL